MEFQRAKFIRFVLASESAEALIDEAKQLTWEHYCEHALLGLESGERILVRGSTYGIPLERSVTNDPFGRSPDQLYVDVSGESRRVVKLVFHTHPKPTGLSDEDLMILEMLGQQSSMLYEIFGPAEGTEIRPKRK
jgi:proteasome lid subunit RPN8/RPN11